MNLIFDIGNTRTKIGIFDKSQLVQKMVWDKWTIADAEELLKTEKIDNIIVSTVKNIDDKLHDFFREQAYFINLTADTILPINNLYKTPRTLGKDRLAAVVGAFTEFPKKNSLVIDAGTCIKYDLITQDAKYYGGSISPGLEMRFKAMHHFTAKLPLIETGTVDNLIGYNTETALRTGVQIGVLGEIEGFVQRYTANYGEINVILTGGDADLLAKQMKTKIFVNHNLVLTGLNKILNYNVELSA